MKSAGLGVVRKPLVPQIVCFPYAGGGAAGFHRWLTSLRDAFTIGSIAFPGRDGLIHRTPLTSIPEMADHAVTQVEDLARSGPLIFLGYSLGALVAFETARRLSSQSRRQPVALIAAACRAPDRAATAELLHTLDDTSFLSAIRSRFGPSAGLPEQPELMRLLLPSLRADIQAFETYQYTDADPLACPTLVLAGTEDPSVTLADAEGWRRHTRGRFGQRRFPGDHFFLERNAEAVCRTIRDFCGPVVHREPDD